MKIEYKIMGVPSRLENIKLLQSQIGLSNSDVFLDTEYRRNPMWTWKQTARLASADATHLVIVQDDAILCERFTDFCEYLVKRFPNAIFTLSNTHDVSSLIPKFVVFQSGYCTGGVAIITPTEYIESIITEQEEKFPMHTDDDNWICYWAHHHGIKVLCTHPCVVSTFGNDSKLGHSGKTSSSFYNTPLEKKWANATSKQLFTKRLWESPSSQFVR